LAKNEIEVAAVDPIASMMAVENQGLVDMQLKLKNSNGPLPLCSKNFKKLIFNLKTYVMMDGMNNGMNNGLGHGIWLWLDYRPCRSGLLFG
jgi:hypothetical protein